MRPWQERPFETRNLFNPAFCGLVLLRGIRAYEVEDSEGMPFSLTLLILPLVLHSETRAIFSASPRTHFIKVVEGHPEMLVGLAHRTRILLPFTLEGLGFAMHLGCFTTTPSGRLRTIAKTVRGRIDGTDDAVDCQKTAATLGKHFARVRDRVTLYTSLGLRP